jgi:tetratricopeptide (TPR) repeat protein
VYFIIILACFCRILRRACLSIASNALQILFKYLFSYLFYHRYLQSTLCSCCRLLIAVGLLVLPGNWAIGQSLRFPNAVLELSAVDGLTIAPETVIQECSLILTRVDKEPPLVIAKAYEQRGLAFVRLKQLEKGKADFDSLCKLRPDDASARCTRAMILCLLIGSEAAAKELTEIIGRWPNDSTVQLSMGVILVNQGDIRGALEHVNRAIALDSSNPKAYLLRAQLYWEKLEAPACLEDVSRYIALRPYSSEPGMEEPYILRATALLWMNRPSEALPNLLLARLLNPSSFPAAFGTWKAYFDLGGMNLACQTAEELMKLNSQDSQALLAAATSYISLKRFAEARNVIEKAKRLEPANPRWSTLLGNSYAEERNYEQALLKYEDALKLDMNNFEARLAQADLLASCPDGKYRDGLKALDLIKGIPETKQYNQIHRFMIQAMAYAECADYKEAVRYAKKALELAAPECGFKPEYETRLHLFQDNKPYRRPR